MKNTLKFTLGVIAVGLLIGPISGTLAVRAQDSEPFPDTPQNHWAYEAVTYLKARGFLVGYPGGLFIGQRPMTRYEFAAATRRVYEDLLRRIGEAGDVSSLRDRVSALETQIRNLPGGVDNSQKLADLQAQLDEAKSKLDQVAGMRTDIDKLNELTTGFRSDLAKLGVDVDAVNSKVNKLRADVDELLARPWPVNIQGDLFFGARATHSTSGKTGVDLNGGLVGVDDMGNTVGFPKDLHFVHELGLDVLGDFGGGVTGHANFVIGNYLGYLGSATMTSAGFRRNENQTDVAIWDANVGFNVGALGGFTAAIGRMGYMVTPYTFARIDPDYYFDQYRYDNQKVYMDGALLGFHFGHNSSLDVFAGKHNNISATNTTDYMMLMAGNPGTPVVSFGTVNTVSTRPNGLVYGDGTGNLQVKQSLGARLKFGLGEHAHIGGTYIVLDGDPAPIGGSPATQYNRVAVYGGDLNYTVNNSIGLTAEYAASQLLYNDSNRLDKDNWVAAGKLMYTGNTFDLAAGYREIAPYFAAPGYWGRIGFWYNPTDLKGFTVDGKLKLGGRFNLKASGEFYEGTGRAKNGSGTVVGFSSDDKINHYNARLNYDVNPDWTLMVDWEGVYWDLGTRMSGSTTTFAGGKPQENYYGVGAGYRFSDKAMLKMMYQVVDYDSKGVAGWRAPGNTGSDQAKGGIFTTQVNVRF